MIGPPKSICISSLGSEHRGRGAHFVFVIKLFRFLLNSVHGLHVFDLFMRPRLMYGHHKRWPSSVIPHAPGWVACSMSITVSFITCGFANLLSPNMQPLWVLRFLHCPCICLQSFLHLCSSLVSIQSLTSRRTESRLVIAAINFMLNTPRIISFTSLSFECCCVSVDGDLDGLRKLLIENFGLDGEACEFWVSVDLPILLDADKCKVCECCWAGDNEIGKCTLLIV